MSEVKLFQPPPTYCPHQYRSAAEMMSTFETNTRTLRYELRSREIYIEEWTSITSPETLLEPPKTQDERENTIQETPNTQFRMLVSVMPCMPHIDSEKSVNFNPSPPSHMITSHTSCHGNKNCRVRKQTKFIWLSWPFMSWEKSIEQLSLHKVNLFPGLWLIALPFNFA